MGQLELHAKIMNIPNFFDRISFKYSLNPFDLEEINPADYHVLGNAMRHRPIRAITEDKRWTKELSEEDLTAIRRVAGRLARSYGMGY